MSLKKITTIIKCIQVIKYSYQIIKLTPLSEILRVVTSYMALDVLFKS